MGIALFFCVKLFILKDFSRQVVFVLDNFFHL